MKKITVALAGNPNAGKTSLFNQLTGARAHVGNYPGVTVEKKEGTVVHRGREIHVVDLPGTYSLTAYSLEELVAREFIINERPDLVVDVVDATNIERNLYLAVQFMEIGIPVIIALNMMDMAESRGLKIDIPKLSRLLGVPVAPTVARTNKGIEGVLDAILEVADKPGEWKTKPIRYGPDIDIKIGEISALLTAGGLGDSNLPVRWQAIKILEGDGHVKEMLGIRGEEGRKINVLVDEVTRHLKATLDDEPEGVIADHRYGFIASVTKQAVTMVRETRKSISDKVDLVVLNRLLSPFILLGVLLGVYHFTFWVSQAPIDWLVALFDWLGRTMTAILPDGPLKSLVVSGIIDGVGGVVEFVPLIAFMFFAIAALEDSGYMARIAFIMDRVLRTFGLHGSSVLSLMVGGGLSGGCAVPGVLAARTLRDPKERLATILVTPFMNCGAKLPVFAVLIAAFFSQYQARMMFIVTLLAWALALLAARLLRWTILKGEQTPFVMELPPYRLPTFKGLLIHTWERVWSYLKKAGTIILAISILFWAMMSYPGLPDEMDRVFQFQRQGLENNLLKSAPAFGSSLDPFEFNKYMASFSEKRSVAEPDPEPAEYYPLARTVRLVETDQSIPAELAAYRETARAFLTFRSELEMLQAAESQALLRNSVAGHLGVAIETVTRPLGFDWRTNIALLGGLAAKEVILSTLGTAYSLGEAGDSQEPLTAKLASEPNWNRLLAFTLILFIMMYSPCTVTLITIGREAGWKWAVFASVYTTAAAWVLCLAVARIGGILGLGQ